MKNKYFLSKTLLFFSCLTTTSQAQTTATTYLSIEAQVIKHDNKDCKGSLEIFTHDGLLPFTYSIDGGKTFHEKKVFENLCEGKYFIQAKDATGKLGLTLVHLTPNPVPEIFNDAENEAIRQNSIKDFLLERERVMDNWLVRREIEYKLSRIGHRFSPIIVNQSVVEGNSSYTFKVLKMNNFSNEIMLNEFNRQLIGFQGFVSEITYNESEGTATVYFTKLATAEIMNKFFFANGFTGLQ